MISSCTRRCSTYSRSPSRSLSAVEPTRSVTSITRVDARGPRASTAGRRARCCARPSDGGIGDRGLGDTRDGVQLGDAVRRQLPLVEHTRVVGRGAGDGRSGVGRTRVVERTLEPDPRVVVAVGGGEPERDDVRYERRPPDRESHPAFVQLDQRLERVADDIRAPRERAELHLRRDRAGEEEARPGHRREQPERRVRDRIAHRVEISDRSRRRAGDSAGSDRRRVASQESSAWRAPAASPRHRTRPRPGPGRPRPA